MKIVNTFMFKGLQLATIGTAVSVTALSAYPSQAASIISSSIVGIANPKNPQPTNLGLSFLKPVPQKIILGNFEVKNSQGKVIATLPNPDTNRNLRVIRERQSVKLSKNLLVWNGFNKDIHPHKANSTIAKNTLVSSYLFYINPPGGAGEGEPVPEKYNWSGTIEFDTSILGIIVNTWGSSNKLVGLENTAYTFGTSLDIGEDFVSFDNNLLSFNISAKSGKEPWRVILDGKAPLIRSASATTSVPEPLTILGSATAIGFGTLFRKIKKKSQD